MSPKSFLHKVGLRPLKSTRYAEALSQSSGFEIDSDPMSASFIEPLFATESLGRQTLGLNFDRLANSMKRISEGPAFKNGGLKRVAELGGGTGLLGLWLSFNNLCHTCDIVDYARNPLIIGEKWAASLGIKNIKFHYESHEDFARKNTFGYDFVFAEHAVTLDSAEQETKIHTKPDPEDNPLFPQYATLAKSMRVFLEQGALGLIGSGAVSPDCLHSLCAALRSQHLIVDWEISSNSDGLQLYIRSGENPLFEKAEDDFLALFSDAIKKRDDLGVDILSFEKMFGNGIRFFEICSESHGVQYRCSISQYAGLALLMQQTTAGFRKARLFSAAKVVELSQNALKDAKNKRQTNLFCHPRLAPLLQM